MGELTVILGRLGKSTSFQISEQPFHPPTWHLIGRVELWGRLIKAIMIASVCVSTRFVPSSKGWLRRLPELSGISHRPRHQQTAVYHHFLLFSCPKAHDPETPIIGMDFGFVVCD